MKMKLLTLLVIVGLFAFGAKVNAGDSQAPLQGQAKVKAKAEAEAQGKVAAAAKDANDVLKLVCKAIGIIPLVPQECTTACAGIADPSADTFKDLSCCMGALEKSGKVPSEVKLAITAFSMPSCTWLLCGPSPTGTLLAKTCGALSCNTHYDNVTNCLNEVKMTCAGNFGCGAAQK